MISSLRIMFLYLLTSIFFMNCTKDEVITPKVAEKKFVSIELVSQIPLTTIKQFSGAFSIGTMNDYIRYGVKVYRFVYNTSYKNRITTASGMLYIPIGTTTPSPLLSAHHGTTFKKSDAPSVSASFTGMELMASAGFITLMPDYIGYGNSSQIPHPYYEADYAAASVIDMVKAVKEYNADSNTISMNNQLFLAGYSEGGYVTLAAQREIENNPSHNLQVTATAAGAGGYDLLRMLKSIGTSNYYSYPSYLAFVVQSFNTSYDWNLSYNYFFNEPYAGKLNGLLDGNKDGGYINNQLTTNMDSLFNKAFFSSLKGSGEMQFKKALIKNSLTDWKVNSPMKLYHGTSDDIIPISNSQETYDKLKAQGATDIELISIKGGTHGSTLVPMLKAIIPWFTSLKEKGNS